MIRFILLLPIKLLGLVFMGISEALRASEARRREAERARLAQAKRAEAERLREAREEQRRQREAERSTRAAHTEATRIRREQERAKAEQLRAAKAAERVREADNDLAHLEQRQRDLATLYSFAESEYTNASTDRKKEAAFRKMMAIDQQRRTAARQAERLQYTITMGGR